MGGGCDSPPRRLVRWHVGGIFGGPGGRGMPEWLRSGLGRGRGASGRVRPEAPPRLVRLRGSGGCARGRRGRRRLLRGLRGPPLGPGRLERPPVAFPSPSFNPPGWKRVMGATKGKRAAKQRRSKARAITPPEFYLGGLSARENRRAAKQRRNKGKG